VAGAAERRRCVAPGQMVRWCALVSQAGVARGKTGAVWHEPGAVSHRQRTASCETALGGRRGSRPSGLGGVSHAGEAIWSFGSETGGGFE
jgi:hypothetical protein